MQDADRIFFLPVFLYSQRCLAMNLYLFDVNGGTAKRFAYFDDFRQDLFILNNYNLFSQPDCFGNNAEDKIIRKKIKVMIERNLIKIIIYERQVKSNQIKLKAFSLGGSQYLLPDIDNNF